MTKKDTAYLKNDGAFSIFSFDNFRLKFAAPYSLEYYERVLQWDNGYLVVMAKYKHNEKCEEEYIDLLPIMRNLYMKPEEFLNPIKKVEVSYA